MKPIEKYRRLKRAGKLHGTIKRAVALREARDAVAKVKDPLLLPLARRPSRLKVVVPLRGQEARRVCMSLKETRPRVSNWDTRVPTTDVSYVQPVNHGNYSSRVKYDRWSYRPRIQSYGILHGKELIYRFNGSRFVLKAPRGYAWGRDENGIKLYVKRHPKIDYHPHSQDLLDGVKVMKSMLWANHETRKQLARKEKQHRDAVKRAAREGAHVCLSDSLVAGNCYSGSYSWAKRHGLEPTEHYTPQQVLAKANGDAARVAVVVTVALRRHIKEMERGYCVLAEHGK